MCVQVYGSKRLAAMLTIKWLPGVTPEENLKNPMNTDDEAGQTSPKVQNKGISGLTKMIDVLQFF